MTEELIQIINHWRGKGVEISDDEAEDLLRYCYRKMDRNRIRDRESYLPLLYADEVKNYLCRQSVNATTILRRTEVQKWQKMYR
ncbi:MAG: hypothetical protein LUC95_01940 [Lachnospiraceae bacterium]|nr:hypothetical protein [Lachnospiraceae bacterium]